MKLKLKKKIKIKITDRDPSTSRHMIETKQIFENRDKRKRKMRVNVYM